MSLSCAPSFCSSAGVNSMRARCATYRTSNFAADMSKKLAIIQRKGNPLKRHPVEHANHDLKSNWLCFTSVRLRLLIGHATGQIQGRILDPLFPLFPPFLRLLEAEFKPGDT